jgi:hypothetical protein
LTVTVLAAASPAPVRKHHIAVKDTDGFFHGNRFDRQRRFVDLQISHPKQAHAGGDFVPGLRGNNVSRHQLLGRNQPGLMELHKESLDRAFGLFGREPVGTKLTRTGFRLGRVQSAFDMTTQLLQQFFRGEVVPESFLLDTQDSTSYSQ